MPKNWKGGRVAYRAGLENQKPARVRGFESPSFLRRLFFDVLIRNMGPCAPIRRIPRKWCETGLEPLGVVYSVGVRTLYPPPTAVGYSAHQAIK